MGDGCSCAGQICFKPWGSPEGHHWKFFANFAISELIVRDGAIVDSIRFKNANSCDFSRRFGGKGGDKTTTIKLDFPSEYLTGVSGCYGRNEHGNNIRSLKFHTNRSEYGPFGRGGGKPFEFTSEDGMITGFHGWAGRYLNAIGVYIAPACSNVLVSEIGSDLKSLCALPPPRSAAAWGGNGGREWDDGVFSAVVGVHACVRVDADVLIGVRFSYRKEDGSEFSSPLHGCSFGVETKIKKMEFVENDEYLIGVEGFCGAFEGVNVIRSLSFMTNKGKYGPFGREIGTPFCSVKFGDCDRKVLGFHGRSAAYLDALGLHTQYL